MKVIFAATTLTLLIMLPAIGCAQERVGTSCADCPNYSGAFSIENSTGVTIPYQYKWGDGPWKQMSLQSGRTETHSYPLGSNRNGRVPTPYVRFDRIGGDGRFEAKGYHMQFYSVGYAGYGPAAQRVERKRYFFKYADYHRTLDILAR